MKPTSVFVTFWLVLICALTSFAQDYTKWNLPEGAIARLGKGNVTGIAYSPDGDRLAIAGNAGVWIYDAGSGEELAFLTTHTGGVSRVAYSPDGTTLATGSWDSTVRLWDATTGTLKNTLTGHTLQVSSVAYSPDGNTIATGSWDNTGRLWDAATGILKHTLTGHTKQGVKSVAYSPDGNTLATGGDDATVRLWDATTGTLKQTLTGHTWTVTSVAYSPDGNTLATGSGDSTVCLWDTTTGTLKNTLNGHKGWLSSVAYSPDGNTLAIGGWNNVGLWDATTGTPKHTLNATMGLVESVAYHPDGNTLATGSSGGIVLLWDVTSYNSQTYSVEIGSLTEVPEVSVNGDVARVNLSPASVWSGTIGDQLTVNANITEGTDVRGYQIELTFDTAALRYVSSADGGYLAAGAFVVPSVVNGNQVTFGAASLQESSEGDGTLAAFTFEVLTASPALPTLSDVKLTDSDADFLAVRIETETRDVGLTPLAGDVNGDGVVNLEDMTVASGRLGQTGENTADMNKNGVVDVADLLLIAAAIEAVAAAPSLHPERIAEMFTATEVRQWLSLARSEGLTGRRYQRGMLLLEQLLMRLIPKETLLLANYPNPFNPETWIPYQLSESADVRISIYAADGRLVRVLALGHQGAGIYESRGRAGYWDGRNTQGESVASGVYFYTLTAGDFTATRRMIIRK